MWPILALLTASLIWGATSPVMKWTLDVVPPFTLAFLRFLLASLILIPLFWRFRKITKEDLPKIVLAAFLGITIHIPLFFFGLKYTFAVNAALIIATVPIFTLAAAALFLGEKLTLKLAFSAILAFLGLILIIGPPAVTLGLTHLLGAILLLAASLSWVGFEIISKKLFTSYSAFTLMFYIPPIGALTLLPFAIGELLTSWQGLGTIRLQAVTGILYGGLFSSTVAYSTWQWGLSKLPASQAGFFLYLEPITAVLVSIILLGERINPLFILGGILVILAVVLAEHKRRVYPLYRKKLDLNT